MELEQLQKISDEEWETASKRLLHFLHSQYKFDLLPQGNSPEDIVQQVICELISGNRKYFEKLSLSNNMFLTAKSIINNLFGLKEVNNTIPIDEAEDLLPYAKQLMAKGVDLDIFLEELEKEVAVDEDLHIALLSMTDDGACNPREICEDTGIPIEKVYELMRRMKLRAKNVRNKLSEKNAQVKL